MRFSLLILFLLISCSDVFSQGPKFSNEFLSIGVGARGMGMAGAVTAYQDNVTAAYWNPACLIHTSSNLQVGAQHAELFQGVANYDYVGFGKKMDPEGKSFGALSLIRLSIDNIPNTLRLRGPDGSIDYSRIESFSVADYAILVSYGKKIKERLSLGANTKIVHRSFGSFAKAWGFGFDAGLLLSDEKWRLGLMARDITTTFNAYRFTFSEEEKAILQQTGNTLPVTSVEYTLPELIAGFGYQFKFGSKLRLLAEFDTEFSTNGAKAALLALNKFNMDPRIGFEFNYGKHIFLRMGIGNFQRPLKEDNSGDREVSFYPTGGIGLKFKKFGIDYAMSNIGNTGVGLYSNYFSGYLNF